MESNKQSLLSYFSVRKLEARGHLLLMNVHVGIPAAVPPPRVELPRREHRHPPQQKCVGGLHLLPLLPAGGARVGGRGGGGSPLLREHLLELSRAPRPAPGDGAGRRRAREITAAPANDDAQTPPPTAPLPPPSTLPSLSPRGETTALVVGYQQRLDRREHSVAAPPARSR
ncbi:unnamed protein product [Ectocarpus sp. 12 AP-2014]